MNWNKSFKKYWRIRFTQAKSGWEFIFRTPIFMIIYHKKYPCWNCNFSNTGFLFGFLPSRWSLRLNDGEFMYKFNVDRTTKNFFDRLE